MRELFSRLRPQLDPVGLQTEGPIRSTTTDVDLENKEANSMPKEASVDAQPRSSSSNDTDSDDEIVHKDAQYGVQKMEATTQAWSKKHLIAAYIM